jgi:hypothetical protein
MKFTGNFADLGNGRIEYLDAGNESNGSYETFLLIPGSRYIGRKHLSCY